MCIRDSRTPDLHLHFSNRQQLGLHQCCRQPRLGDCCQLERWHPPWLAGYRAAQLRLHGPAFLRRPHHLWPEHQQRQLTHHQRRLTHRHRHLHPGRCSRAGWHWNRHTLRHPSGRHRCAHHPGRQSQSQRCCLNWLLQSLGWCGQQRIQRLHRHLQPERRNLESGGSKPAELRGK